MMLDVTPEVLRALRSSHVGGVRADAFYMGELTAHVGVVGGDVTFQGDGEIQGDAKLLVSGNGPSLVPNRATDPLAPFGQEVAIWRTVTVNKQPVEFPMGVYRIVEAAGGREFLRGDVVTGWEVSITLQDRFSQIIADDFTAPESPAKASTVWGEIQRLAPIPVLVNPAVDDATVHRALVYESRFDAIVALADLVGGVPHMTRNGELTIRPKDAWLTQTVAVFDIPGVIDWDDTMSSDFYNQVQVRSTDDNSIVAWASITDEYSPLAVSRAGGRTYKHASPLYKSRRQAQTGANTILARVSQRGSRDVQVVVGAEGLLLELGDFGRVTDPVSNREVLGEVATMTVPFDVTEGIRVGMIVAETR